MSRAEPPASSLAGSFALLVADLADDAARDFLEGVARGGQVAYVPLLAAPVDRSTHSLEVYSPGAPEPFRCLADPIGPPNNDGFPLRLRLLETQSTTLPVDRPRPPSLRARHATSHELSDRHTADLEGTSPIEKSDLSGRELATGKLVIEALIGSGGAGAVYKGRHRTLLMPVAVKVLHDNFQADADFGHRFHAEALAASRLDHPNITRVLDFGQEPDGLLYLVMEYLDGVGLRSLIDHKSAFPVERIVRIGSQICAGLAHAHARSILHKDVKPENLVILQRPDDDGIPIEVVKVCDFGIAQHAHSEQTERFQGTPEYMSPEQCVAGILDARSDVYSTGIVLYELAAGHVPFTHEKVEHTVWCQIHQEPERPKTDPRLERVILRAIAKDPEKRFPTMRDLRAALRDLMEKPPASLSGSYKRFELPRVTPQPTEWLVRGGIPLATEHEGPGSAPLSAAFMQQLVQTADPRAFAELTRPLDGLIRQLAKALDVDALWRLASTLDVLATEGPETPGSRAATSVALLRVLRDPGTLAPIAYRALAAGDPTGERLIIAAGAFGAHALYSARVRQTGSEVRQRFRLTLEQAGTASLPILSGGLERLADRLSAPNATSIAEDLLLVAARVARAPDDAFGALVALYARSNVPALARAAVIGLPALWRERSRPLVLGLLDHPTEEVVAAALDALTQLAASDEHTPRHVARVFDRAKRRGTRLAAIAALKRARGDARPITADLLVSRLRSLGPLKTSEEGELGLALAAAILATAPSDRAREEITAAARDWPADLRARVLS